MYERMCPMYAVNSTSTISARIKSVFIKLVGYMMCDERYLATMLQHHTDVSDNRSPDSRGHADHVWMLLRRVLESAQCGHAWATTYAALPARNQAPPVSQNGGW